MVFVDVFSLRIISIIPSLIDALNLATFEDVEMAEWIFLVL